MSHEETFFEHAVKMELEKAARHPLVQAAQAEASKPLALDASSDVAMEQQREVFDHPQFEAAARYLHGLRHEDSGTYNAFLQVLAHALQDCKGGRNMPNPLPTAGALSSKLHHAIRSLADGALQKGTHPGLFYNQVLDLVSNELRGNRVKPIREDRGVA
jgi:hypothetical protein